MATLATYETEVLDLLHDPSNLTWSDAQVDRYINEARRKLVMDTGCLRTLQTTYITQGVEAYTFGQVTGAIVTQGGVNYTAPVIAFSDGGGSGVAATLEVSGGAVNTITLTNFGSGYTSVPSWVITDASHTPTGYSYLVFVNFTGGVLQFQNTGGGNLYFENPAFGLGAMVALGVISANTYDVLGVSVLWGNQRYALQYRPFSQFSAIMRGWTTATYQRQPIMWTNYGDTGLFIGPAPDQNYVVELDTIILPTDLTDYATIDPIPRIAQDPIKFYAAYLAKFNNQSYGEAEMLLEQYQRRVLEVSNVYTRRIPDIYAQLR